MRIISFINEKGGVGKTTTVVNTAYFLAKAGHKVLMVDFDPQASATSIIGLGSGHIDNPDTFTSYDIFYGNFNPTKDMQSKYGVDVIPADDRLAGIEMAKPNGGRKERILSEFFKNHKFDYDFVLLDCKGAIGLLTINALVASTDLVVVMQSQYLSLEGFPKLLKTVNTIKSDLGIRPKMLGILVTMFNKGHMQDTRQLEKIKKSGLQSLLFDTVIRTNTTLSSASESAVPVGVYDPSCRGSMDYMAFSEEFVKRINEGWVKNDRN